jgi:hypothetical protein
MLLKIGDKIINTGQITKVLLLRGINPDPRVTVYFGRDETQIFEGEQGEEAWDALSAYCANTKPDQPNNQLEVDIIRGAEE